MRGVPDVAYVADPVTALAVYDTTVSAGTGGWFVVGGTSVGAPQWAALVARAQAGRAAGAMRSPVVNALLYRAAIGAGYALDYRDIVAGANGSCGVVSATVGYDFVTGLGSPLAAGLVPALAH